MNTLGKTALLEAIEDLSRRYPDWRLGQLVANVAGWADQDIWYAEDENLLAAVQSHLSALDSRVHEPAGQEVGAVTIR